MIAYLIEKIDSWFIDKIIQRPNFLKKLLSDARIQQRIKKDDKVLEKMITDENVLKQILNDSRTIKQFLLDKNLKSKVKYINAENIAANLDYLLPTFLVSFPRSGSNFLQMILQASSGLQCQSIYVPVSTSTEPVLSLKSHAVSLHYLFDEILRFIPDTSSSPSKIILLQRDPRDVLISFFEYTQAKRNIQVSQEEFLNNVCYFYASTIDKTFERKLEYAPLNIIQAYKKHIENWFIKRPDDIDCLVVKFEDLILSPGPEFQRIFDFLQLNCSLAKELIDVKVSQYSQSSGQRGQPQGWQIKKKRYSVLIGQTESLMKDEIQFLKY